MADVVESDVDYGDEEWPDNNVDPETSEGAAKIRRSEAALATNFQREAEMRRRQFRGPTVAYDIPASLYKKAQTQQDQLTDDERALLLSRGDVVGKALAQPASLTPAERYEVLRRPPPDVVRASVRRVTCGALSEPADLFAKVREANVRGQLRSLSDEEVGLVARNFREKDDSTPFSYEFMAWGETPGNSEATNLLAAKEGIDMVTFAAAGRYLLTDPDVVARKQVGIRDEAARNQAQRSMVADMGSAGDTRRTILQQPIRGEDGSAASGMEQDWDGEQELNAIADRMEELQRQRDRGDLAEEEFRQQHQDQITILRTYARKRSYKEHPSAGPISRSIHPFPHSTQAPTDAPFTPRAFKPSPASYSPAAPAGILPPLSTASALFTRPAGPGTHPGGRALYQSNWTIDRLESWAPGTPGNRRKGPFELLADDLKDQMQVENLVHEFEDHWGELEARWMALTEEERAAYEARSEALRQESWVQYDNSR
ncbi:hypothetical protein OIDMADRAFT_51138 [Oidiodendron maius Zn]|uniref:Uncharacterized protein n=1 Tax=Oidiodendron maius (strain Zn) TaxID=913774 RepID=A0A0C3HSU4_OIDMZ|nr:hypothetical protein OIDMADRAFT_51138 [Oidiodendron maius Zn]